MEKLRTAIDRARRKRNTRIPVSTPLRGVADNRPGGEAWARLPQVEIAPDLVARNRLVSFAGGQDAGPHDMLRTRILQVTQAKGWHRVALVSPHQGSGKTTTTANLAFSFGRQQDRRTMVLDLDLRRVGLAKVLGLQPARGMSDVLSGLVPFSEHGVRLGDNVILGLNSQPARNPSEILQSHKAREMLDAIEETYRPDIMLFDMPPLLATDDGVGFLKNVDCALLLAEVGKTTVEQVDVTERQIGELTNVIGVVLNKATTLDPKYGYE